MQVKFYFEGEFLDEIRCDIDKIDRRIVRLTMAYESKQVTHLSIVKVSIQGSYSVPVAGANSPRQVVTLTKYVGQYIDGNNGDRNKVEEVATAQLKALEKALTDMTLSVRAGSLGVQ